MEQVGAGPVEFVRSLASSLAAAAREQGERNARRIEAVRDFVIADHDVAAFVADAVTVGEDVARSIEAGCRVMARDVVADHGEALHRVGRTARSLFVTRIVPRVIGGLLGFK